MTTTEKKVDEGVQQVLIQILKAAKGFNSEPERAEEYIRRKVNAIYQVGKQLGRDCALQDIFNGPGE